MYLFYRGFLKKAKCLIMNEIKLIHFHFSSNSFMCTGKMATSLLTENIHTFNHTRCYDVVPDADSVDCA